MSEGWPAWQPSLDVVYLPDGGSGWLRLMSWSDGGLRFTRGWLRPGISGRAASTRPTGGAASRTARARGRVIAGTALGTCGPGRWEAGPGDISWPAARSWT